MIWLHFRGRKADSEPGVVLRLDLKLRWAGLKEMNIHTKGGPYRTFSAFVQALDSEIDRVHQTGNVNKDSEVWTKEVSMSW